jgi:hypothetical protein
MASKRLMRCHETQTAFPAISFYARTSVLLISGSMALVFLRRFRRGGLKEVPVVGKSGCVRFQ